MSGPTNFLIIFDHELNELRSSENFGLDIDTALTAYSAAETEYRNVDHIEVVLIGADSIETIMKTHSNYFKFEIATSGYFAGI